MTFIEWIDKFMDEEEKVHFLDAGLMKSAWNAAIDEAVKVANKIYESDCSDVADKIKELKE